MDNLRFEAAIFGHLGQENDDDVDSTATISQTGNMNDAFIEQ